MKIEKVILPERMYNQVSYENIEDFEKELPAILNVLVPDFGFSSRFSNKLCNEIPVFGNFMGQYNRRNAFALNREGNEPLDAINELVCVDDTNVAHIITLSDPNEKVIKLTIGDSILLTSEVIKTLSSVQ